MADMTENAEAKVIDEVDADAKPNWDEIGPWAGLAAALKRVYPGLLEDRTRFGLHRPAQDLGGKAYRIYANAPGNFYWCSVMAWGEQMVRGEARGPYPL